MTDYKPQVKPSRTGNGFTSAVIFDGEEIYNSETVHGAAGRFGSETDADTHAQAMADAYVERDDEVADVRSKRSEALPSEVSECYSKARKDDAVAKSMRDAAKTAAKNAAQRRARVEALATSAESPEFEIVWANREDPGAIEVVARPSIWDSEFEPERVADPRQLSLDGVAWTVEEDDGVVSSVKGYGRLEVEVVDGFVRIVLGAKEHTFLVEMAGDLVKVSEDPGPEPATAVSFGFGKLSKKGLVDRLRLNDYAPATLVGAYSLELAGKSRSDVTAAIVDLASEHDDGRIMGDLVALDDGRDPSVHAPDLAAATLLSWTDAQISESEPGQIMALALMCSDRVVIGGLLDDEAEGENRDEVITGLRSRMGDLS